MSAGDEFEIEGPVTAGALQALSTALIAREAWADGDALIYSAADGKLHPVPVAPLAGAVVSVNASSPLASSGGVAPIISLTGVVDLAHGGTGSATGDASNLINIPAAQLAGDVALARLATALAAGGDPIKGTVLTATTRIDAPTIGTGSTTQHALPGGTADLLTADSTATVTNKTIDAGQLTGSVLDARLSANVALLSGAQTFTGQKTFPGAGTSAIVLPAVRQAAGGFDITVPVASGADSFALLAQTQTLTNKSISGASNTLSSIGNSSLTNSSVTVTASTGLTGGGAVALGGSTSLSIDSTVATLAGSQTLTNKSIDGGSNTLTNLPASALTGSIADARLSANVALLASSQTFTGQKTFPGAGATAVVLPAVRQANGGFDISVPLASDADSFALVAQSQTLTNKSISGSANTLTAIGNSSLTNSSLTVTASTGLTGGGAVSLGGSTSLSIDSTVATLTGAQALTNKTINAALNTISNIANASLTNSSLTVTAGTGLSGGGAVSLGGSISLSIAATAVSAASYPTSGQIPTFTVGTDGRLTAAGSTTTLTSPAIATPVFSGTSTGTWTLGGTPTLGVNLAAGGFKLTGLAAGAVAGDSLRFEQGGSCIVLSTAVGGMNANDYFGPGMIGEGALAATTNITPWVAPCAGTMKNFALYNTAASTGATNITVIKATGNTGTPSYSATTAVMAVSNGAKFGSDITHILTLAQGDLLILRTDHDWLNSHMQVVAQFTPS